jgi:hypothetical protein
VSGAYKVSSNEIFNVEAANENVEVLGQRHKDAESQRAVAAPQAKRRLVAHGLLVNALRATRFHKIDVCHQDGDPSKQTKDRDQVDEVAENSLG